MGRVFVSHRYEAQYYWSNVTAKFCFLKVTSVETAKRSFVTPFQTQLKKEGVKILSWMISEGEIWQTENVCVADKFSQVIHSAIYIPFPITELNFHLRSPFCLMADCNPCLSEENLVKSEFSHSKQVVFLQSVHGFPHHPPFSGLGINYAEHSQSHSVEGGGGICPCWHL